MKTFGTADENLVGFRQKIWGWSYNVAAYMLGLGEKIGFGLKGQNFWVWVRDVRLTVTVTVAAVNSYLPSPENFKILPVKIR